MRLEERISHAKQSSDLTYRSITRPNRQHDSDVIAALGAVEDSLYLSAKNAAGERGAVYVRDMVKDIQRWAARKYPHFAAYGMAMQVAYEVICDRCVPCKGRGKVIPDTEYSGEPAGGWPECPICLGSGMAKIDSKRRAVSAGAADYSRDVEAAYREIGERVSRKLITAGGDVWKLLR